MFNIFLIFLLLLSSSCSFLRTTQPEPEIVERIVRVDNYKYPDLPILRYPPDPNIIPFEYDWPRLATLEIRDTSTCLDIEENEQDESFWKRCGVQKLDEDSNLYIGFTLENYTIFVRNWNDIMSREQQWKVIIDTYNDAMKKIKNVTTE